MSGEALGAAALAQSAAAMAMAQQARKDACNATISAFDSKTASIEQAKSYADCISLIYPSDLSSANILILKAIFIVALIGMGIGAWKGWKESYGNYKDHIIDAAMLGAIGFMFVPIAIGAVMAILAGIVWLFT